MTNNEKRADEICARFNGMTFSDSDEPLEWLRGQITEALNAAYAEGYKQGAEKMREDAKSALHTPELNQLDELYCCGGVDFYGAASCGCKGYTIRGYFLDRIDHIPITPPKPAPQTEDDKHEMREAFEKWAVKVNPNKKSEYLNRKDSGDYIWTQTILAWEAWQAAWKEKRK